MSKQLTNSELNWIEGWVDALDADTYAAAILRKMVAALQSAPPASERTLAQKGEDAREDAWLVGKGHIPAWASATERETRASDPPSAPDVKGILKDEAEDPVEPEYEHLGDYSAVEPWHRVFMSCDRCKVTWDGCWDNYQCPRCGEGELPWQPDPAPADRPECSVCNDAPTTPFCSFCGQRPTQSDRPEPPLREGAMRAAEGCDSPHPDGDRPEPSEALEAFNTFCADFKELTGIDPFGNEAVRTVHSHLSQPAPPVPDASWVNRKTKEFRESAGELRDLGDADSAELLEGLADDMERARAYSAQGVPDVYTHVATIHTSDPFDERDGIWLSWENRKEAEKLPLGTKLFAAAPTPTDDGENDARDERTR